MNKNIIIIILIVIKIINTEWIQISQNHYEKLKTDNNQVYRSTTPFHNLKDKIYANESFNDESPWSRGKVVRVNNMATIKRVYVKKEGNTTENKEETAQPNIVKEQKPTDMNINAENLKPKKQENSKRKEHQIENVIKFLKIITETISRNTQKSFGSKLRYLRALQNSIMASIEDRIEATWPDDSSTSRAARSVSATKRGHVDFPSSESTLMTLSFLTFAVFLIKLVLQVIQTYKNKTMMVAPAVFTVAKAAVKGKSNE